MAFKEKLEEIFGFGASMPQEEPKDVIELTPLEDFRNNVRAKLNGIKTGPIAASTASSPCPMAQPQMPCGGDGMIVERQNEIGVSTLQNTIKSLGPQQLSAKVAKLSTEKNEVDKKTGIATSQFDKFVGGLKQEAVEALMGSDAEPPAEASPEAPPAGGSGPAPTAPKTPGQPELPDLTKL